MEASREQITVFCTSCMTDRIITSNGKCRVCGWKLLKPKHWDTTIRKFELIYKNREGFVALEIKNQLYFVPIGYLDRFGSLDRSDMRQVGEFIESIKKNCDSFKI